MARLQIRLLGGFDVELDGRPIEGFESDTARALLARLVVEPGHPVPRLVLADLLWPHRPTSAALANLRHALAVLRKTIADTEAERPLIRATATEIAADPGADAWIDVAELLRSATGSPTAERALSGWERVAELDRGELLAGFELDAGEAWDDWLNATRARVVRATADALGRLADVHERSGRHAAAELLARRLLELDPWDSGAHRRLLRLLALQGRPAAALDHADRLAVDLRRQLDTDLDPTTRDLVEQIRTGHFPSADLFDGDLPAALFAERALLPQQDFVDREAELAWLDAQLAEALSRAGRVVLVAGEAGTGKTMLIEAFAERAQARMPNLVVARGRCNAFTGVGDPYLPFRQILGSLCGELESAWASGAITVQQARRLWRTVPDAVTAVLDDGPYLLGGMIDATALQARLDAGLPGAAVTERLHTAWPALAARVTDPMRQQQPLLDHSVRVLQRVAGRRPLLVLIDDLQWADPGTVELLFHLARQIAGSAILVVAAYRPEQIGRGGRASSLIVAPLLGELRSLFGEVQLELGDSPAFLAAWLDQEPNRLDAAFRQQLLAMTRGHPLFTVEVVQAMRRRGELLLDDHGRWHTAPVIDWATVPPRVEAVIGTRLTTLSPVERNELEAASVQGETFAPDLVASAVSAPTSDVERRLDALATVAYPLIVGNPDPGAPGAVTYRFRHGLFQRVLYAGIDPARRRRLHAATAAAMLAAAPDDEARAVDLARHFDEAGLNDEAIDQHARAGRRAMTLSATTEAIGHFQRALELATAEGLPDEARTDAERRRLLTLLTALGSCLQARHGYTAPPTDAVYERVRALAALDGSSLEAIQALGAVVTVDCLRARYASALEGAERLLAAAAKVGIPLIGVVAHMQAGLVTLMMGRPADADTHLRAAFEGYDPVTDGWLTSVVGQDVGATTVAWWAVAAWELGRPDEARCLADQSIALARRSGHPFSLAFALAIGGCLISYLRSEPTRALQAVDELAPLADREDFAFYRAASQVHGGLARALAGDPGRWLDEVEHGLESWRTLGTDAFGCWVATSLAEQLVAYGRIDEAERLLSDVEGALEVTGEAMAACRWWLVRGRAQLAAGDDTAAEPSLRTAIDVCSARRQWGVALQASTELARLLQRTGRGADVDSVLRPALDRIVGGDDTSDVRAARAALRSS